MFGFLKDKLKKAVKSISEKFEKKEPAVEKPEVAEKIEEIKPIEVEPVIEEVRKEEIIEEKEVEEIPAEEKIEPEVEIKPEPELKPEIKVEKEVEKIVELPKVEEAEEIEEVVEKPKEKKGFFKRIAEKIVKKVVEKKLDAADVEPILDDLVSGMIEADVAYEVAEKIKSDLHASLVDRPIKRGKENEVVVDALRQSLLDVLTVEEVDLEEIVERAKSENKPAVLLFLGFNGSGKTTTIAKVARWLIDREYSVALAAGDTWRKAAIEQLEEHGAKLGVKVIKHTYGADPAAIIYDGVEHCKARGINVLLGDTAGRTHVNQDLIDELKKVVRVNKPDLKILVMDSLVGNDAVPQSQIFNEAVGVDAVIFTKNDVNEKGGAILSVTYLLKKPILFLGTGQNHSDLIGFNKSSFVKQLLGE